jgi:hypothetical protein
VKGRGRCHGRPSTAFTHHSQITTHPLHHHCPSSGPPAGGLSPQYRSTSPPERNHAHIIPSCLGEIEVLSVFRCARQVAIRKAVGFIFLIENVIDEETETYLFYKRRLPGIAQSQIICKIRVDTSVVVFSIVQVLLPNVLCQQGELRIFKRLERNR